MSKRLYFHDHFPNGSPVIIFLHGLGSNGTAWLPQISQFKESGFRSITIDLPGFGRSANHTGSWSIQRTAAVVVELAGALKIDHFFLVGLSMGGTIALQAALDFPQRVERLVLASTFASLRPRNMNQWFYLARRFIQTSMGNSKAQAELVAKRIFSKPEQDELRRIMVEQILESNPVVYRTAMRSLAMFDARSRLHSLVLPTLVITGADDTTIGPANQLELSRCIPNSRHVIIPSAGHAVNIDQPEIFNQYLLEFFKTDL